MQHVDMRTFRALQLAGDYYLWNCFSLHVELDIVNCVLSAFRRRKGQLSEAISDYRKELGSFCSSQPNLLDRVALYMDRVMGISPRRFNSEIISFDFQNQCWGEWKTRF